MMKKEYRLTHPQALPDITPAELEAMLEAELAKPEDKIDVQLVDELLLVLTPTTPVSPQATAWESTLRALEEKQAKRRRAAVWPMRIAAVLVAMVCLGALGAATYQVARALEWQWLLRCVEPFAEVFTIRTSDTAIPTDPSAQPEDSTFAREDTVAYAALEEMPATLWGYPVRPSGLPERFTYLQGGSSIDARSADVYCYLTDGEDRCGYTVLLLHDASQSSLQVYECTPEALREEQIGQCSVLFYHNTDSALPCASWVFGGAQYTLFGNLTEGEMRRVIEATMGP